MKKMTRLFIFICLLTYCIPLHPQAQNIVRMKSALYAVRHVSITIDKSPREVYQYASNPSNFPQWLAFVRSIKYIVLYSWRAETDQGPVTITMTPPNAFGVMDHDVKAGDGTLVHNPLRVIENGSGSEVIFTLYKTPDKSQADLDKDAALVKTDLETLKKLLESATGKH